MPTLVISALGFAAPVATIDADPQSGASGYWACCPTTPSAPAGTAEARAVSAAQPMKANDVISGDSGYLTRSIRCLLLGEFPTMSSGVMMLSFRPMMYPTTVPS